MREMLPLIMLGLTLLILIVGIVLMMFGNKFNLKYSNKLMSMRVIMQALTVIGFAILYYIQKKSF
jgi:hypothetical protein